MNGFSAIFDAVPRRAAYEIERIASQRCSGVGGISELHLCVGRKSSLIIERERVFLGCPVSADDMRDTVARLCEGAVYAHRDTISAGYISMPSGVRVGIVGRARYENDRAVGISEVSSLVFRVPTQSSSLLPELYSAWERTERGMLVYAKAGVGKTTALRSLSAEIALREKVRIVVVDERCEFSREECEARGIVLMRGYRRAQGMEIALRTMSPDIIVVDEIGAHAESVGMVHSLNSGVKLIATAHANTRESLYKRMGLAPFFEAGAFDTLFGIFYTDATYSSKMEKISD